MKKYTMSALVLALTLIPKVAFAHDGPHSLLFSEGFFYGFMHPILGIDHLLAMLCVGVISSQLGGKAIWQVPATFVIVMAVGGALGILGIGLPAVETAIALSVLALGAAIVAGKQFPLPATLVLVAGFALFHGHAHGEEMPSLVEPLQYAVGFMTATTIVHLLGVGIGEVMTKGPRQTAVLRLAGAGVLTMGIALLAGF